MAFSRLTAALSGLETAMDQTATRLREQAASIRASVSEIESTVRAAETRVAEGFDRIRDKARERSEQITSLVDTLLTKTGNQFDDLRNALENDSGQAADLIKKLLDQIELGAKSVDELKRLFGDAMVGGQRLRDLLNGADFGKFKRDIQQLIRSLKEGALSIDELLRFLNERGGDFGKTVASWIEAFEKGEISLKRLKDLINGAEEEFAGTDFAEFLDEIEDAIDTGRL